MPATIATNLDADALWVMRGGHFGDGRASGADQCPRRRRTGRAAPVHRLPRRRLPAAGRRALTRALLSVPVLQLDEPASDALAGSSHYGIVTTCAAVAALAPHALVAWTLNEYVPGPTEPDSERSVVGNAPENAPVTLST